MYCISPADVFLIIFPHQELQDHTTATQSIVLAPVAVTLGWLGETISTSSEREMSHSPLIINWRPYLTITMKMQHGRSFPIQTTKEFKRQISQEL